MRGPSIRRAPPACAALAALLGVLAPTARAAEGPALVVGVSTYAGQTELAKCTATAHDVADALRRHGMSVVTSIDAPAASLRNAVEDFAADVATAPGTSAIVYVCAAAETISGRVFLLPADVDLRQPSHAQTVGVAVLAGLGALAGANGVLAADLNLRTSADAGQIAATLRAGLPPGNAFALRDQPVNEIGTLGRALAGIAEDNWASMRQVLQEQVAAGPKGALALYDAAQPVAAPPPVSADGPPPDKAEPPASGTAPEESAPAAADEHSPDKAAQPTRRSPAHAPVEPVRSTERVRRLQAALARHGHFSGPVDGRADGKTLDAIRRYQASVGDPPTGTLTQSQILKLLNAW